MVLGYFSSIGAIYICVLGGTETSTNPYVHLSQANYEAALETLKCPPVPDAFKGKT